MIPKTDIADLLEVIASEGTRPLSPEEANFADMALCAIAESLTYADTPISKMSETELMNAVWHLSNVIGRLARESGNQKMISANSVIAAMSLAAIAVESDS